MTFSPAIGPVWLLVVALLLLPLPLLLVPRNPRLRHRGIRVAVICLRLLTLLLLLLILANPVTGRARQQPRDPLAGIVLVDTSKSMSLGSPSRLREAVDLLEGVGSGMDGRLLIIPFDTRSDSAGVDPAMLLERDLGTATHLGAALARALPAARGSGAEEIVVISDGRVHDRAALASAAVRAGSSGIRVSVLPVGSAPARPNLALVNVLGDRQIPAGSRVPITAVLRVAGCRDTPVELQLRNAVGTVLERATLRVNDGLHRHTFHAVVGDADATLTVAALPLSDELSTEDNELSIAIEAVRRPLRVLYMEGSNHKDKRWTEVWAYDFIADALREQALIEVDVFTVDEQVADGGRLFKVAEPDHGFPTDRNTLLTYDVVICSDINRSIFTEEQLSWTRELVADRGGGFCMIGGYTAFGAGMWDRTVWEQMIPVDMMTEADGYKWEDVVPRIPESARTHPLWHLDPDPDENARILAEHPPFLGFNLVNKAKPAATVLARHEGRGMPLICVQPYGRGRSMAFVSDAAGGWGERYQTEWGAGEGDRDNRYYRRFWVNAVRWLGQNSLAAHRTRLFATTDAVTYLPGDTVGVRARKLGTERVEDLRALHVSAALAGPADGRLVDLRLDEQSGEFRGVLPLPSEVAPSETAVLFTATGSEDLQRETVRVPIRISGVDREWSEPAPDHQLLADLAGHTNGRVLRDVDELIAALRPDPERTVAAGRLYTVPLWDSGWLWATIVILLSSEWLLRKRMLLRGA